jgi:hypothetical protein
MQRLEDDYGNDGEVEVGEGRYAAHNVRVIHTYPIVALSLAPGVPERVDWAALEPYNKEYGNAGDDVY